MNLLKIIFAASMLAAIASNEPSNRETVRTFEQWKEASPTDQGKLIGKLCRPYEDPNWELEEKIKFRSRVIRLIDELAKTESGAIRPYVKRFLEGIKTIEGGIDVEVQRANKLLANEIREGLDGL